MIASELTTSAPTSLVLRRTFNAPIDRVFNAWLSADALRAFMGGENHQVLDASTSAHVGGPYRIVVQTPDEVMAVGGMYREIVKNKRIVCTWTWEEDDPKDAHETLLTLEFSSLGDRTELVLTHENLANEQSRDGHAAGWKEIYETLARLIAHE